MNHMNASLARALTKFGTHLEEMVIKSEDSLLIEMMGLEESENFSSSMSGGEVDGLESLVEEEPHNDQRVQAVSSLFDVTMTSSSSERQFTTSTTMQALLNGNEKPAMTPLPEDGNRAGSVTGQQPRINHDQASKNSFPPLFWNDLPPAPKAAGDLYEAVVGAVFVDSGFDIEATWHVVRRTLVEKWWHRFDGELGTNEGFVTMHPHSEITQLVDQLNCGRLQTTYVAPYVNAKVPAENINKHLHHLNRFIHEEEASQFHCTIELHGHTIGFGQARSKWEAKRAAAAAAVAFARSEVERFEGICTCQGSSRGKRTSLGIS